ncbi:MAG TPA: SH3 domain-containing C40 family peptidase [Candidatus Sulfotelmatobacter sp.]
MPTIPLLRKIRRPCRVVRPAAALAVLCMVWMPAVFAANSTQIIVVPVANIFSAPSDDAQVVSQAIYGSNVTLLIARGEWCRIQTADHSKGWVRSRHLRLVQSGNGYATSGETVQVESLFANLYQEPEVTRHKPVLTIPFEARLEVMAEQKPGDAAEEPRATMTKSAKTKSAVPRPEGWLQVRLPDKRSGWIQSSDVVAEPKPLSIAESIELAKRFLGIPYLWGGSSSFGFDCSGFTQMLMRARGFNMPRDADKQAAWTGLKPVDRPELQPGDLLFFGSTPRNITQTGMYIGEGQFIQATTNGHAVVQISRLDDQPWTQLLVASRRVK